MPEIIIVDQHHEAVTAWEKISGSCGQIPQVLSLDFHTDVLDCRRRGICLPENAAEAVKILRHDEHFDWALRQNIISRAVIIALSPCPVPPEHPMLEVRRSGSLPEVAVMLNEPEKFRPLAEKVLDDEFLSPLLSDGFPSAPYILDIDCDVILCERTLLPRRAEIISRLAENAVLITLSREDDWVKILKLPGEKISGSSIAAALAGILRPRRNNIFHGYCRKKRITT